MSRYTVTDPAREGEPHDIVLRTVSPHGATQTHRLCVHAPSPDLALARAIALLDSGSHTHSPDYHV